MKLRRILPLLLALALAGAACGDSDTPTEASAGNDTETTSADGDGGEHEGDEGTGGKDDEDGDDAADAVTVLAKGIAFKPAKVTIATGGTVTWKFDDGSIPHNVKNDGGEEEFASENQTEGTFEHTFETAGEYDYVCTLHPNMKGTVTVE